MRLVSHASRQRNTRWLTALLAAGFILRAFIPVGYMPGNLLAGEFVELCPVGIGTVVDSGHHAGHYAGHVAHHDGAAVEHDPNKSCPLGLGIKFLGTPVVELDVQALEPPAHRVLRLIDTDVLALLPSSRQPRAPPARIPA